MRYILMVLTLLGGAAKADTPGDFDYYVLSLSWSPNWCTLEGDARQAEQCTRNLGWSLHGLWPQYESGWPDYCQTPKAPPSRRMTEGMADIMGSSGLAWHQWKKHGTCSGLSADDYYRLSRLAFEAVKRPAVLRRIDRQMQLPASVIEEAFQEANPNLSPDGITITCRDGHIQEARICLTRDLMPRTCGSDVIRDCTLDRAILTPVR